MNFVLRQDGSCVSVTCHPRLGGAAAPSGVAAGVTETLNHPDRLIKSSTKSQRELSATKAFLNIYMCLLQRIQRCPQEYNG